MALVNGSDYDHIDFHSVAGGDVTRHMLKDAQARQDVTDLKSAIDNIHDQLTEKQPDYDWGNLIPGQLGWAKGYYGANGTVNTTSVKCMRTYENTFFVPNEQTAFFTVEAPTGYYIAACEYDSSGTFIKRIGYQGLPNSMDGVTESIAVYPEPGYKYHFSLGVFSDCTEYLTSEFVATIKLNEYVKYVVREIDELNSEVDGLSIAVDVLEGIVTDTESYDWSELSPGNLGWANGFYGRTNGAVNTRSTLCMRTVATPFWEPLTGTVSFHIQAPTGYYVAAHVYNSGGTFVETIGFQGLPSSMTDVTEEVTVNHMPGNKYHFSVGVFDDVTDYLNSEFVNTIVLTEYGNGLDKIRSTVSELENDVSEIKTATEQQQTTLDLISEATKNLFDYQNANVFSGNFANVSGTYKITTGDYKLFWLPVVAGRYYSIQKISSYRFRYGTTATEPRTGVELLSQSVANDSATAKTLLVPSGANYLVVMYYSPDNDSLTETAILKSIMVEEGQNVTNYVPAKTALDSVARQMIANAVGGNLFAMYDNLTCIGDSLTYSEVFTGTTAHRQANRTYPQVLSALSGNSSENLGRMGYSTAEWWAECGGVLQTKTNQLFVVYLGTNEGLTDTIDADCPGDEIANYADTNTGCYGKILQTAKNLGANAVLIHIYGGGGAGGVEVTNSVIDKFGERYNFAVLDNEKLLDNCYHIWPNRQGMNNLHYNDLGYAVFAGRLISQINSLSPEEAIKLVPLS